MASAVLARTSGEGSLNKSVSARVNNTKESIILLYICAGLHFQDFV